MDGCLGESMDGWVSLWLSGWGGQMHEQRMNHLNIDNTDTSILMNECLMSEGQGMGAG